MIAGPGVEGQEFMENRTERDGSVESSGFGGWGAMYIQMHAFQNQQLRLFCHHTSSQTNQQSSRFRPLRYRQDLLYICVSVPDFFRWTHVSSRDILGTGCWTHPVWRGGGPEARHTRALERDSPLRGLEGTRLISNKELIE